MDSRRRWRAQHTKFPPTQEQPFSIGFTTRSVDFFYFSNPSAQNEFSVGTLAPQSYIVNIFILLLAIRNIIVCALEIFTKYVSIFCAHEIISKILCYLMLLALYKESSTIVYTSCSCWKEEN